MGLQRWPRAFIMMHSILEYNLGKCGSNISIVLWQHQGHVLGKASSSTTAWQQHDSLAAAATARQQQRAFQ